ncbi:MAG: OmpA family protein [Candidatus Magnetomorum sp.]|nr:OmpA family protein [Candidatus Magnetomorum sp.]
MNTRFFLPIKIILALVCLLVGSVGCVLTPSLFDPYNFKDELHMQTHRAKVDHLIILLDASISMTTPYLGKEKFQTAIMALHQLNQSLTAIRVPTGFRVIGTGACHFCENSKQLFNVSPFDPSRLHIKHLKKIHPGGESPLASAILEVKNDFTHLEGPLGLIVISDWDTDFLLIDTALRRLCDHYANRIHMGNIVAGTKERAVELSKAYENLNECVQWYHAEKLLSYNGLKDFTQQFFLTPVKDQDADGVKDFKDKCLNTLSGALVDEWGCPKDSDADGIYDGLDMCRKTPENAPVDSKGCWKLPVVFYKKNQIHLTREQEKSLALVVNILGKDNICLEIQGHTDISGTDQENFEISQKRAQSVKAYFLSEGLRHYQMRIKAMGSSVPLDRQYQTMKNATQRRVEFKVVPCQNQVQ